MANIALDAGKVVLKDGKASCTCCGGGCAPPGDIGLYIPISSALANQWINNQYITVSMSVSGSFSGSPFSFNSGNFVTTQYNQSPCISWWGNHSGGGDGWIVNVELYNVGSNYYIAYQGSEFQFEGLITNSPLTVNPSTPPYCSQLIGSTTATVGGNIVNSYGCTIIPTQNASINTMTISLS